jgi:hypothetical protein
VLCHGSYRKQCMIEIYEVSKTVLTFLKIPPGVKAHFFVTCTGTEPRSSIIRLIPIPTRRNKAVYWQYK